MLEKNIALIGFMGSGKSVAGRLLADALSAEFADSDDEIVNSAGMTIAEIFEKYGEPHFRLLEKQTIARLCARKGIVLATGGGAILDSDNIAALKGSCIVVFLDVPAAEISARLGGDNTRPVLAGNTALENIKEKLQKRVPLYRGAADITVSCGARAPEDICGEIMKLINP